MHISSPLTVAISEYNAVLEHCYHLFQSESGLTWLDVIIIAIFASVSQKIGFLKKKKKKPLFFFMFLLKVKYSIQTSKTDFCS